MLKFRVDNSESRRQVTEVPVSKPTQEDVSKSDIYEEAVPYVEPDTSATTDIIPPISSAFDRVISPQVDEQLNWKCFDEQVLHEAIVGLSDSSDNNNSMNKHDWNIPESGSDDEIETQRSWSASKDMGLPTISMAKPAANKFNLPSDSEDEEHLYATATSPSLSHNSAEPPMPPPISTIPTPPPVSTIPRNYSIKQAVHQTIHTDTPPEVQPPELRKKLTVSALVDLKKRSITSASDTDPYDEIDYSTEKQTPEPLAKEGQSEPRYQFTLSKSRPRLNPDARLSEAEDTYAEIPRKTWNFPSSSDEDETNVERKRHKKVNGGKPKLNRLGSSTSEDEKPLPPPKLWESAESGGDATPNAVLEAASGGSNGVAIVEEALYRCSSGDSGIKETKSQNCMKQEEDVTIEYSALEPIGHNRKGSLLGADINELNIGGSPTFTHSSGFEENYDNIDALSVQSENSLKAVSDYEQSSTCVDMDQLSLDSSGKNPKRIVETHETHEIVPADNNEDDIVERIIETQTITEKLDDNLTFPDHGNEDYSKYLENDDEFVSHIFTVGRTLEKGAKKKKSKDFAFVENPFSVTEPMIETMPLEKKTVKQKITTLVKKKKAMDDENVYAEVKITDSTGDSVNHDAAVPDSSDQYDRMHMEPCRRVTEWDEETGAATAECREIDDSNELACEPVSDNDFSQHPVMDRKKEGKPERKSLFKGIKKLLKKKDKNQDACKLDASVLDDDYQEFVP